MSKSKRFFILSLCLTLAGYAANAQTIPAFPLLHYGDPTSKVKVLAFMSAFCSDCQKAFKDIVRGPLMSDHIKTGKVYLTIFPLAISDGDVNFETMLACSDAGFAKAFEWHMVNGFWNQWKWTLENGNAAGLGIPEPRKCKIETAINRVILDIRAVAETQWKVTNVPFFVVGGDHVLADPNWGRLKDAIDKAGGY